MKKPKLIFFSQGHYEKEIGHYLLEKLESVTFPYNYKLKKKDIRNRNVLVVLWFSEIFKDGEKKLFEIVSDFPTLPVFIITETPEVESLITAIRLRVKNIFLLPLNKEEFTTAIIEELKIPKKTYKSTGFNFNSNFQLLVGKIFHQITFYVLRQQNSIANVGVVDPSNLNFLELPSAEKEPEFDVSSKYDLKVKFLGNYSISLRNQKIPFLKGRKNNSILAYILFNHQKQIHRDILMNIFWRDNAPSAARNSLNVALCNIRKQLASLFPDEELICFENERYFINPSLEVHSDVEQFYLFLQKAKNIEHLQGLKVALPLYNKALAFYKGDFLTELLNEEWCESERDNLKENYLMILNSLSDYYLNRKEYDACINLSKKMLETDLCLEEIHCKLMRCYFEIGLLDLAVKQYFKCEKILKEELGIEVSESTKQLLRKIQSGHSNF